MFRKKCTRIASHRNQQKRTDYIRDNEQKRLARSISLSSNSFCGENHSPIYNFCVIIICLLVFLRWNPIFQLSIADVFFLLYTI